MSHAEAQHSARGSDSVKSPRCAVTLARETSSRRTLAYDRSSSFSRTTAGRARPTSSGTSVSPPSMSSSIRSVRTSLPPSRSYRPIAIRCGRRVGSPLAPTGSAGASWRTANAVMFPAASVSIAGRRMLMPAVSSHAFDQVVRSRPEVSSRAPSRSDRRVFPNACALKYACTPLKKASVPT